MTRKTTRVQLDCEKEFGPEWDWMPKTLADLIPWAEKYLALVPEDYRATAAFETVAFRYSRRDHWLHVKVHYLRPETDAEMAARLEAEEKEKLAKQELERQKLQELKERFSDR
ncbi:MAG: hypothetical protein KDB61_12610 [Planctomycetes bacterium]|nr:hypothetical protein [Planctomycetota bacterium]